MHLELQLKKTTYGTKYTALNTYINTTYPLFTNLTTTTVIDNGDTLRLKFKEYYDARTGLLNAISAKAKTLADTAKSSADTANGVLSNWCYNNNTTYINGSKIYTGTLSANAIFGGTLTVGGDANGNGIITVKDSTGATVVIIDKDGVTLSNGARIIGHWLYICIKWNWKDWLL